MSETEIGPRNFASHAEEYEQLSRIAAASCDRLQREITQLLRQAEIRLAVPIESRIKSWQSIRQKLLDSRADISSVYEMQDVIGLRVVLLFKRDAERACEALANSLQTMRRYDTWSRLQDDQFGYASTHIVTALPSSEGIPPEGITLLAEVQVRTVAQHLWAAASHLLQYKRESAVPPPVRRSVHRVAALLETVDLELERVLEEREEYTSTEGEGYTDADLNVDLLRSALEHFWPQEHRISDEPYGMLLEDLERRGLRSSRELYETMRPHRAAVLDYAIEHARELAFKADRWGYEDGKIRYRDGPNRSGVIHVTEKILAKARSGVFFSHTGLTWGALALADGTGLPAHS
jgi:ppGpp synthetase/RelA/SpoT-type nucleotidyltranferase